MADLLGLGFFVGAGVVGMGSGNGGPTIAIAASSDS